VSDIIQQLHTDHINVSKLLDLLEREIEALHNEETPDCALMLDVMHYMVNYPDLLHHPTEDVVFEKLKECDPDAATEVDHLTAEHQVLADKGTQFLEFLRYIENETVMVSREAVEAQGEDYIALLRKHMSKEEGRIFPLARKLLAEKDWRAISAAVKKQEDPVFGKTVAEEYRTLYDSLVPQAE
jgi:hemerythrin-like domain-containing protein